MQQYWVETNWLNTLPGNPFEFPPLLFEFLASEKELEALYADKDIPNPVQLAVVFDQSENLFDTTKDMYAMALWHLMFQIVWYLKYKKQK